MMDHLKGKQSTSLYNKVRNCKTKSKLLLHGNQAVDFYTAELPDHQDPKGFRSILKTVIRDIENVKAADIATNTELTNLHRDLIEAIHSLNVSFLNFNKNN